MKKENSEKPAAKMQGFQVQCGKFFGRVVKDFRQKELLPLKLLFFVHASTLYVLYPYLTIHMRELGINVEETAIMSAVTPVIAIVMPPVAGMIADKIGNFKLLLCLFSSLGGTASLLLLLVPVGRITVTYPEKVVFSLGCDANNFTDPSFGNLRLTLGEDLPCNRTDRLSSPESFLQSRLETCGVLCQSSQINSGVPLEFVPRSSEEEDAELSVDSILKARSYSISRTNIDTRDIAVSSYNLSQEEVSHKQSKQEALSERFMKNNENFRTAIRRVSRHSYFLPATELYQLICSEQVEESDESSDFLLPSGARLSRMKRDVEPRVCRVALGDNGTSDLSAQSVTEIDGWLDKSSADTASSGLYYAVKYLQWNDTKIAPTCVYQGKEKISATVFLHNPKNNFEIIHNIKLEECQPQCLFTANRANVCSNMKKEVIYNPSLTFWVYLVIRVFIGIIGGTAFAMFEGAVIAILREQKADYGLQRIYASIGGMISSPLSGIMIDYASQGKGYTDFRPAFYLYAALKIGSGILMLLINLEFKSGAENVVSDVMAVLKKIEVIALLVACFVLGTAWGYIESFLFWLLQDLGGSRSLMGITITVGGIAGIPLLALSGPIINKIGHANVIFIGFIFYGVRLIGYSVIYNPWHCLFFEAMESITTSLSFTAAVTYAAQLSTPTTDSSVQGLLGGVYFGVGKGAGSLVGGYMMKTLGTRPTYQIFAAFTIFMGCVYYLFNRFYLRHRNTPMNDFNKKPDKIPKEMDIKVILKKPVDISPSNGVITNIKTGDASLKTGEELRETRNGSHENNAFVADEKTEQNNKLSGDENRQS